MAELVVGIDLGTTNSLVSGVVDGKPTLFSDQERRDLLPSAVAMDDQDRLIVGRPARNRRLLDPEATVLSIKRKMGQDVRVRAGRKMLSPPEVSALILGTLLDWVERTTGARPTRAVITVPAYFGDAQRQATRDAGEIAGLTVERLVNEPTAAALTYETGAEERVLVYDFGGGTFDVSVLERDLGFLEVRASRGDTELGGDDLDRALARRLLERLGPRAQAVEADPRAMVRLLDLAERAKIALSSKEEFEVIEPYLTGKGEAAVHLETRVSRNEFNELARPFVERSLEAVEVALREARLQPRDLDRVLLVGGTSKLALVSELLSEKLGRPAFAGLDADRAVGLGAGLLAGRIGGHEAAGVLVDVTPHTIAVGVLRDLDSTGEHELSALPIIPRNTVVPVERSKASFTMVDDQEQVEVPIVQGEGETVGENTRLGTVVVSELPPSPAGSTIDLSLRLDLSGILHASATHRSSGKTASVVIANSPYRLSEQRREQSRRNVEAIRGTSEELRDDATEAAPERGGDAEEADRRLALALIARAERALAGPGVDDDARARVTERVAELGVAVDQGAPLEAKIEALSDALLDL